VTKTAFDPLAEAELAEAIAYYDGISPDLGDFFLKKRHAL